MADPWKDNGVNCTRESDKYNKYSVSPPRHSKQKPLSVSLQNFLQVFTLHPSLFVSGYMRSLVGVLVLVLLSVA